MLNISLLKAKLKFNAWPKKFAAFVSRRSWADYMLYMHVLPASCSDFAGDSWVFSATASFRARTSGLVQQHGCCWEACLKSQNLNVCSPFNVNQGSASPSFWTFKGCRPLPPTPNQSFRFSCLGPEESIKNMQKHT